jgi:hypothetical protein
MGLGQRHTFIRLAMFMVFSRTAMAAFINIKSGKLL